MISDDDDSKINNFELEIRKNNSSTALFQINLRLCGIISQDTRYYRHIQQELAA